MNDAYNVSPISELLGLDKNEEKLELQKKLLSLKFVKVMEQCIEQNNISKTDLAKEIGYSKPYITQVFSANKNVNIEFLTKFQNAVGMPFDIKLGNYANNNSPMSVAYNRHINIINDKFKRFIPEVDKTDDYHQEQLEG